MTKEELMKLQTYKLFEDEEAVYVDRNDVLELLEREPCEDCCNGDQIKKAKLCQKSYLAGMGHRQDPCEDLEYEKDLNELKEQILKEGNTLLTKQDLLERFCEIDKEYNGRPWNLLQILANINILIGQQPCGDATDMNVGNKMQAGSCEEIIYKQAAIDALGEKPLAWAEGEYELGLQNQWEHDVDAIRALQPVQPKIKTGYWIDTKHYKSYDDGDVITTLLMCSNCKEITEWNTESSHKPYYCESCGAKMIDPQENEGQAMTEIIDFLKKYTDGKRNTEKVEISVLQLNRVIKALEQQPSDDGMEKHTDRQIYDGCIYLMQKMVDYFQEYLEYLGYDLDKLDEDERFAVGISNMEIVRTLFLSHTRNSGGCSTRDFCKKIGIDGSKSVKFEIERDEA